MSYVDGFVAAVPTVNKEIYKQHAIAAAVVFKEHGALKLVECWGDDVPDGKRTSFPLAVQRQQLHQGGARFAQVEGGGGEVANSPPLLMGHIAGHG